MRSLNYQLLAADMYSYYPAPHWWIRRCWNGKGIQVRLGCIGFGCHIGPGRYHNGRKWIVFVYGDYDNYLENGGF